MSNDFSVRVTRIMDGAMTAIDNAFSLFDETLDGKRPYTTGESSSKVTKETVDGVKRVVLEVEVPGCGKGDVDITAAGNMVTVAWKAKIDGLDRNCQFAVGPKADLDSISAKIENGYLTIVVLRKQDEKDEPKKVKID
jgi:HSP20 family molecular chaperone IbpA